MCEWVRAGRGCKVIVLWKTGCQVCVCIYQSTGGRTNLCLHLSTSGCEPIIWPVETNPPLHLPPATEIQVALTLYSWYGFAGNDAQSVMCGAQFTVYCGGQVWWYFAFACKLMPGLRSFSYKNVCLNRTKSCQRSSPGADWADYSQRNLSVFHRTLKRWQPFCTGRRDAFFLSRTGSALLSDVRRCAFGRTGIEMWLSGNAPSQKSLFRMHRFFLQSARKSFMLTSCAEFSVR